MTDNGDIAAMLARLDGVAEQHAATQVMNGAGAGDGAPQGDVRIVVATDWSSAAVPLTMMRAFRAIVGPGSPVTLVFAVPHEPTQADAECIHVLLDGVDAPEEIAGLEVESFAEASTKPYDSAVVPTGDSDELIGQVGGVITRLHDVVRRLEREGGAFAAGLNAGSGELLQQRLSAFEPR